LKLLESADLLGITDKALGQKMRKYQILWPTKASEQQH
jgi:hypothetical protein